MKRVLGWTFALLCLAVTVIVLLLAFPPERWIADRVERLVAERTGYALGIGELRLDLLSTTPSAALGAVSIDGD